MSDRADHLTAFLHQAGWGAAKRVALAGDASARRYERLGLGSQTAVLMDAPPETGENVRRFSRMAHWLRAQGFSAPEILAEDAAAGFLLLEDLGDALFARIIAGDPAAEPELYAAATDFLAELGARPAAGFLLPLDGPALADLLELTLQWYLPGMSGDAAAAGPIPALVSATYDRLQFCDPVTSMRDFHAENLIWLPQRAGIARVGLLDFQDAMLADPAYDLVSLLQDGRRDVSSAIEAAMIDRFCHHLAIDRRRFGAVYALLGAQRALRILGVFARLCLEIAKPHYLAHMPRVWAYLLRNLAHPELSGLADCVRGGLPAPTPERLQRMKNLCGLCPTP